MSPEVTASADDPSVTPTVVTADPPTVRVPALPIGATLTVRVSGTAALACTGDTTVVTASATNAVAASASAVLPVAGTPEVCDGMDNNCDGQVDEGGDALCDDGVFCNGVEACGGAAGCQPGTPPSCDDGNPCTTDACDATLGCTHTPLPGCPPCTTPADCNDGNACTTDACLRQHADPGLRAVHQRRPVRRRRPPHHRHLRGRRVHARAGHRLPVRRRPRGVRRRHRQRLRRAHRLRRPRLRRRSRVRTAARDLRQLRRRQPRRPGRLGGPAVLRAADGPRRRSRHAAPAARPGARRPPPPAGDLLRGDARALRPPQAGHPLQLSDASGTLFCTTIPAGRFRHTQRLVFAFTDRAARAAGGLERVEFRINRRGNLLFRARGRGVDLRPVVGGSVRVTLRVGKACARTTMALRTSRKGLVFP